MNDLIEKKFLKISLVNCLHKNKFSSLLFSLKFSNHFIWQSRTKFHSSDNSYEPKQLQEKTGNRNVFYAENKYEIAFHMNQFDILNEWRLIERYLVHTLSEFKKWDWISTPVIYSGGGWNKKNNKFKKKTIFDLTTSLSFIFSLLWPMFDSIFLAPICFLIINISEGANVNMLTGIKGITEKTNSFSFWKILFGNDLWVFGSYLLSEMKFF